MILKWDGISVQIHFQLRQCKNYNWLRHAKVIDRSLLPRFYGAPCTLIVLCDNATETRTGIDDYESMDVDVASGSTGPQRCMRYLFHFLAALIWCR